ncbi:MAG: VOC family protein [Desulfovibrio sp.]|nr:MAG: VOC family protein [Desulfovibrio sp.]
MAQYTGVNHLAMVTGDMDATIRFWRDLLGLPMVAGLGRAGYRHYFFSISEQDMIAFFEWQGVKPLDEKDHGVPVTGRAAFDHVSLGVASSDDLWEIKDKLEAAGFWASELVDHGFIHSLYSFDPNGIAIEFSAPVPDVDLRAHPRLADPDATDVALEGPRPQPGKWPAVKEPTPDHAKEVYPGEGDDFLHAKRNLWDDQ